MTQQLDYVEGEDIVAAIGDMKDDTGKASGVHALRDKYGADVVQLIGWYPETCGVG